MKDYTCPHCKNPIYDEDALSCHFCGESLHRPSNGAIGKMRYGNLPGVWVGIVILIILIIVIKVIL